MTRTKRTKLNDVPPPWCEPDARTPLPRMSYNTDLVCVWAGYLPPSGMETLYTRIRVGTATEVERNYYIMQWYRIITMMMASKMRNDIQCGYQYRDGWLFTMPYAKPRHQSLFEYLTERVIDLTYGTENIKPCKSSFVLYMQVRMNFWTWKSLWELTEAGVGGLIPFTSHANKVGRHLVDYHYWRNKAKRLYKTEQPTVKQAWDLLNGNEPRMLPDEDELKPGRRMANRDKLLELWSWYNEVLSPSLPIIEESDL